MRKLKQIEAMFCVNSGVCLQLDLVGVFILVFVNMTNINNKWKLCFVNTMVFKRSKMLGSHCSLICSFYKN